MSIYTHVKKSARKELEGNRLKAVSILVILFLLNIAVSALHAAISVTFNLPAQIVTTGPAAHRTGLLEYTLMTLPVSAAFALFSFLLTSPLALGQYSWYWGLDTNTNGLDGLFLWFSSAKLFFKSILLKVNIGLRLLPWLFLTIFTPCILLFLSSVCYSIQSQDTVFSSIAFAIGFFGVLMLITGIFLFIYKSTMYFLACYLMVEDSSRKISECIRTSVLYTRNIHNEIFIFILSFFGWFALSVFIFPLLYTLPYFNSSRAVYAKYLIYSERVREDASDKTIEFRTGSLDTGIN